MRPEDFEKKMSEIERIYEGNVEVMHSEADKLMCELLIELGYKKGVEIFTNMKKWYA